MLEDTYNGTVLMTGFFTNALLAAGLAYMGDSLAWIYIWLPLFAFGIRIFNNFGLIRRDMINRYQTQRKRSQLKAGEKNVDSK